MHDSCFIKEPSFSKGRLNIVLTLYNKSIEAYQASDNLFTINLYRTTTIILTINSQLINKNCNVGNFNYFLLHSVEFNRIHMAQCTSPRQYFPSLSLTHFVFELSSCLKSFRLLHWMRLTFTRCYFCLSPRRHWQQHQQQFVCIWHGRKKWGKVKWSICEFKAITSAGWQLERPKKFALSSIK